MRSYDAMLQRKEQEVEDVKRVEATRDARLGRYNAEKVARYEKDLVEYRKKIARDRMNEAAVCECMRAVSNEMCSLSSAELTKRQAECSNEYGRRAGRSTEGARDMGRFPKPPPPTPSGMPAPEVAQLMDGMNDCLKRKVPYYTSPIAAFPGFVAGPMRYPALQTSGQPLVVYDPASFNKLEPVPRALVLARPVADYVLRLREKAHTVEEIERARKEFSSETVTPLLEIDRLMGFLVRCVYDRGLIPPDDDYDPRRFYRKTFAPSVGRSDMFWRLRESNMSASFNSGFLPAYIAMDLPLK
jgi:hypothetical protein